MKIVFFGSSHGYPEPHRKCSSTLIEVGDKKYFIDMGCNCAEGLANRRVPIEKIDGIFNSKESVREICFNCSWHEKCLFYQKL